MMGRELAIFPLHVVLFPGMALPLHVFEERYKLMVRECLAEDRTFGVVLIKSGREVGGPAVPYPVGTTSVISAVERLSEGRLNLTGIGGQRFRILEIVRQEPYLAARVQFWQDEPVDVPSALVEGVVQRYRAYVQALRRLGHEADAECSNDPSVLSFQVAAALRVQPTARQELLELPSASARLEREFKLLGQEMDLLRLLSSAPRPAEGDGPFSRN